MKIQIDKNQNPLNSRFQKKVVDGAEFQTHKPAIGLQYSKRLIENLLDIRTIPDTEGNRAQVKGVVFHLQLLGVTNHPVYIYLNPTIEYWIILI